MYVVVEQKTPLNTAKKKLCATRKLMMILG